MSKMKINPSAPSLTILENSRARTFLEPLKKINEGHDVPIFLTSKAYGDVMTFLLQLNRAMFPCVIKDSNSEKSTIQTWELGSVENLFVSRHVKSLVLLLDRLNSMIDEVPPDPGPRRFGNASFRRWYELVESRLAGLGIQSYLSGRIAQFPHATEVTAVHELKSYFLGSFGSAQRLDYGSGHELSFLAFLAGIWKLGGFQHTPSQSLEHLPPGNEDRAIVIHVFSAYLTLIRRLIKTYTLEPAGSHGVWGLDDHSFIPYIFGSAQYGPPISPSDQTPTEGSRDGAPELGDVAKIAAVDRERTRNTYFGAIGFIHDVKKGPFWEHSPMLYDISGVRAGWGKINKGMIKMYNVEVLSKFPVVQHFPFGSLFSWEQDPNAPPPLTSAHTSNQPMRDFPHSSLKNASARAPPPPSSSQEGTKAPWAANPSITPTPDLDGSTKAPWARAPAPLNPSRPDPSPSMLPTAAPWANPRAPSSIPTNLPPPIIPQSKIKAAMTSRMRRAEADGGGGGGGGDAVAPTTINDDKTSEDGSSMPPPSAPTKST